MFAPSLWTCTTVMPRSRWLPPKPQSPLIERRLGCTACGFFDTISGLSLYSACAPHNSDFFGIPTSPHQEYYPKIHHTQDVGRRKCYQTAYKSSAVITPSHRFNSVPRGTRPFRLSVQVRRTTMWDSRFDNSKDPPGSLWPEPTKDYPFRT